MLPQVDGFEFIAKLRETADWQSIPIVVVTAKDLTPEEQSSLNKNVERIILKGTSGTEKFLDEVRELVTSSVLARRAKGD